MVRREKGREGETEGGVGGEVLYIWLRRGSGHPSDNMHAHTHINTRARTILIPKHAQKEPIGRLYTQGTLFLSPRIMHTTIFTKFM